MARIAGEIKENVNMLIRTNEAMDGKNRWDLRVVSWNDGKPKLEKRNFWRKSLEEEFKPGKLVGLDNSDLEEIFNKLEEIKTIMRVQ